MRIFILSTLIFTFSWAFSVPAYGGSDVSITSLPELPKPPKGKWYSVFESDPKGSAIFCVETGVEPEPRKTRKEATVQVWRCTNNAWEKFGNPIPNIMYSYLSKTSNRLFLIVKRDEKPSEVLEIRDNSFVSVGEMSGHPKAIIEFKEKLYAWGSFYTDTFTEDPIVLMMYSGKDWQPIKAKCTNAVDNSTTLESVVVFGNKIVVAGRVNLKTTNGEAHGIAMWDGKEWSTPGFTSFWGFNHLAVYQGKLYLAGNFTTSGRKQEKLNNILCWDGSSVDNLMGGTDGMIYNMFIANNTLVIAGYFDKAGDFKNNKCTYFGWDGKSFFTIFNDESGHKSEDDIWHRNWCYYNNKWLVSTDLKSINNIPLPQKGLSLVEFK